MIGGDAEDGFFWVFFVQLYEFYFYFVAYICIDMYFNVFVLIHFVMCLEKTCCGMGRRNINKLYYIKHEKE